MAKVKVTIGWQKTYANAWSPKIGTKEEVIVEFPHKYYSAINDVYNEDFDLAYAKLETLVAKQIADDECASWYFDKIEEIEI